MGVGSCTLSNSPDGLGNNMIQDRIAGLSWKEIADKYELGSPGAARSKFQKLTGIGDFKIKGKELKHLVDNNLLDSLKATTEKVAKKAVKEVDTALQVAEAAAKAGDEGVQAVGEQIIKKARKSAAEEANEKLFNVAEKYADDVFDFVTTSLDKGQGYLFIQNGSTGLGKTLEFSEIDEIAWHHLLAKNNGDVWKTYLQKPTSKNGFESVKTQWWDLKKSGLTDAEAAGLMAEDFPQGVIDMINDGSWKMPPMGSKQAILSHSKPSYSSMSQPGSTTWSSQGGSSSGYQYQPTPSSSSQTAITYTDAKASTGFQYHDETEWINWHNSLPQMRADQFQAWKDYTGSGYSSLNAYARTGSASGYRTAEEAQRVIKLLDETMEPTPFDAVVTRYTGPSAFKNDVANAGGTVVTDPAVLSTAIHKSGTFSSKEVRMEIHVPKGTRARYVDTFSSHKGEKELVLPQGTALYISHVEKTGYNSWLVKAIVMMTGA